jgi:hypothetical protein
MNEKLTEFAQLVEQEQIQHLQEQHLDCEANIENARTRIIVGQKYAKIDVGNSGKFMVEMATGNIFGIKAYGQIHKGHFYGTLDTTNEYFWGEYYPKHKTNPTAMAKFGVIPKLTFAPKIVQRNGIFDDYTGPDKPLKLDIAFAAAANGEVL